MKEYPDFKVGGQVPDDGREISEKDADALRRASALPLEAAQWLPHRPPIRMVTRLLSFGVWSRVEAEISVDNRFLRDGMLDAEVLPEIVAQACAAVNGFEENTLDIRGMLTGMRGIRIHALPRGGEKLYVDIHESAAIDNYHALDFKVILEDGSPCAEGELSTCRLG